MLLLVQTLPSYLAGIVLSAKRPVLSGYRDDQKLHLPQPPQLPTAFPTAFASAFASASASDPHSIQPRIQSLQSPPLLAFLLTSRSLTQPPGSEGSKKLAGVVGTNIAPKSDTGMCLKASQDGWSVISFVVLVVPETCLNHVSFGAFMAFRDVLALLVPISAGHIWRLATWRGYCIVEVAALDESLASCRGLGLENWPAVRQLWNQQNKVFIARSEH